MAKARSGGGITSNKLVQSKAPKAEPKPRAISPGGVSQLGEHVGTRRAVQPLDVGRGYQPKGPTSNMGQGPGANRQVHRCGSQGTHGPVNLGHSPQRRDTLAEFGPDIPGRRR